MKNSRRDASKARSEERAENVVKVTPIHKVIFEMGDDILRLPDSEAKRTLVAKMGDLVDAMDSKRSAREKRSEAFWRQLRYGHEIKREGWLIVDRRKPQPPKSERYFPHSQTIENNTSLYRGEGNMRYVLKGDGSHRPLIMKIISLMPKGNTVVHTDEKERMTIESSDSNVLLQLKMAVPSLQILRVHEPLCTGSETARAGRFQAESNGTLPQSGVDVWDEEKYMLDDEMEEQRGWNHHPRYSNSSSLSETEKVSQILERIVRVIEDEVSSLRGSGNLCQARRPLQARF